MTSFHLLVNSMDGHPSFLNHLVFPLGEKWLTLLLLPLPLLRPHFFHRFNISLGINKSSSLSFYQCWNGPHQIGVTRKVVLAQAYLIKQHLNKADTHSLSANSSKLQLHTPENTNVVVLINIVTSKKYWEESKNFQTFASKCKNLGNNPGS